MCPLKVHTKLQPDCSSRNIVICPEYSPINAYLANASYLQNKNLSISHTSILLAHTLKRLLIDKNRATLQPAQQIRWKQTTLLTVMWSPTTRTCTFLTAWPFPCTRTKRIYRVRWTESNQNAWRTRKQWRVPDAPGNPWSRSSDCNRRKEYTAKRYRFLGQ